VVVDEVRLTGATLVVVVDRVVVLVVVVVGRVVVVVGRVVGIRVVPFVREVEP
jgi:hypothetical protein